MAVRTHPTLSLGLSARLTEAMALSPSSFCKSDELEDEGINSKTTSEGQQQSVLTEDTAEDKPLCLGYYAARSHSLERVGDTVPNTYETPPSLVGTLVSPKWSLESPPVSPVIPSPVATPAPAAELDEGALLEIRA
ncbi:hypothetical protein Tco_1196079 [Tanacetum coccineum]